ncbi:pentatricopeptide repeat-containing protein At3g06430, chloroplastic [Arachis stenosperma]|uniref:pentatricopeptide repeat-containing protein At3g06430, chloroplastic n=1 Tax=Arachis stenosperma TaxID=217475 RepID=UPI0025AC58F7|nr:pentatricopeptide repeat-containing protein At3g06430, chloroplastic [Arachis stenosperma]
MVMASISLSFSSSVVPSPIPHDKFKNTSKTNNPRSQDSSFRVIRFAISSPTNSTTASSSASSVAKKRHWKQGEYPGVSETSLTGSTRRSPIKNIKKKLDKKNNAKAWVNTVTEALCEHIDKKQWLQALEVFDMLKEHSFYEPKEGTYMKLIVLLGKSGQPDRARQLFETMIKEGCNPTSELYTALLAAYCRSNLIDEAFSILNEMKNLPLCQPDVFTYSTLIKACMDALKFDMVELLYEEMAERNITPNTVTQNIVLSGYGRAGMFDLMEKVLSSMLHSTTCKPDVWTMNIIISVFGNMGQIDTMEKWYEKFRNFGIEPETRTFNILIGAYGKKRLYDKMSSVMEYMRKLQFPWTTSTYNNVIEAFADVGDAKHMECTFDQMRAEGMKADTKTFCCLINGYANAGLFHKVISSVRLAAKFEVPENTSFYNAILSACAKAEDLMEMERVFKRMKDKQCRPDETTFSIMVEAYRKEGMNDKIYYLEQEKQAMMADDNTVDNPEDEHHDLSVVYS